LKRFDDIAWKPASNAAVPDHPANTTAARRNQFPGAKSVRCVTQEAGVRNSTGSRCRTPGQGIETLAQSHDAEASIWDRRRNPAKASSAAQKAR
jgi:hypothetical protein